MGDFVKASTPLPARKVDARPPVTPEQEIDAADVNNLWDAAADVRTHTTGFVNVRTYGAKGDGVTDDASAFASALAAAPTGGTLVIPPGTYALSATLTIPANVHVHGWSKGLVTLLFTGTTSGLTIAGNAQDFAIEHLTLSTSNAGAASAIDMSAGTVAGSIGFYRFTIRDVSIKATGSGRWAYGLNARNAESANVIGLVVFMSSTIGVYLADSCNQLKFYDLEITGGVVGDATFNRGIWVDTPGTGQPEFFGCTSQGRFGVGSAVYVTGHAPKFYGLHAEVTAASGDVGDVVINGTSDVVIAEAHITGTTVLTGVIRGFTMTGSVAGAITFGSTTQGAFVTNSRVASITDNGAVGSGTNNGNGWQGCRLTNGNRLRDKGPVELDPAGSGTASTATNQANAIASYPNATLLYWRQSDGTTHRGVLQLTSADQVILEYPATKQLTIRNGTPAIKATITDTKFTASIGFAFTRVTPTYATSVTIDASLGNEFVITPTDGVGFTVNNPASPAAGQRITIRVVNTFGVLGALTFGGLYKASAWTQPANGFSRAIDFQYNGTNWIEASRTPADVPN